MAKKKGKKLMKSPKVPPAAVIRPLTIPSEVCRLCETREGPFLNIFDGIFTTAKKIEELMPFGITENDELPHKICFRCSAKVEELYEFVQKCIKTQENLHNMIGKSFPSKVKKHRSLWEEKLNRSNITNDDICDAVIKKAMEGIKNVSLLLSDSKPSDVQITTNKSHCKAIVAETKTKLHDDKSRETEIEIKHTASQENDYTNKSKPTNESPETSLKLCLEKCDDKPFTKTRSSRLKKDAPLVEKIPPKKNKNLVKSSNETSNESVEPAAKTTDTDGVATNIEKVKEDLPAKQIINAQNITPVAAQNNALEKSIKKPFDIMDHVSMIKVNGVGVLFQCKLCNRNFLKKDVVLSHWCAKNGVAKDDFIKRVAPPEVPRIPTVKYINTKVDDFKKQHGQDGKHSQNKIAAQSTKEKSEEEMNGKTLPEHRPKPKIGPASKVKRTSSDSAQLTNSVVATVAPTPQEKNSSLVQCPVIPSLNCRYKLIPGPNNTFTLVEACPTESKEETVNKELEAHGKKRKLAETAMYIDEGSSKQRKVLRSENVFPNKIATDSKSSPDVIETSVQSHSATSNQPYPVGLFQTVSHHANKEQPPAPAIVPFVTSAQKKQSYTIVQTGNPSKLLISAKPQLQKEELPKKKSKKIKPVQDKVAEEPFSVTLEDTTHPKDSGFFTFINVDPLLQPSYVLPTDSNIIQESQISASKAMHKAQSSGKGEQYTCNMCNEVFTREQKLLVHIHSHYNKMDEEDQMRSEKNSRKRGKKS